MVNEQFQLILSKLSILKQVETVAIMLCNQTTLPKIDSEPKFSMNI